MKVTAQSTVKIVLGQAEIREAIRMYLTSKLAQVPNVPAAPEGVDMRFIAIGGGGNTEITNPDRLEIEYALDEEGQHGLAIP